MASWRTFKFKSPDDMADYLNGMILGSKNLHKGADVDGLTFIFEVNGGGDTTVTFAPAKSRPWTIDEIVAQINASEALLASIKVVQNSPSNGLDRRIKLVKDLTSFEVKAGGTANGLLGFGPVSAVYVADTEINYVGPIPGEQNTWVVVRYA